MVTCATTLATLLISSFRNSIQSKRVGLLFNCNPNLPWKLSKGLVVIPVPARTFWNTHTAAGWYLGEDLEKTAWKSITVKEEISVVTYFSCGHGILSEALSVGLSVSWSVTHESKNWITSVLDVFFSVSWWWGGVGCGWRLDAPAHPSATILWPCITCLLVLSDWWRKKSPASGVNNFAKFS